MKLDPDTKESFQWGLNVIYFAIPILILLRIGLLFFEYPFNGFDILQFIIHTIGLVIIASTIAFILGFAFFWMTYSERN